MISTEERALKDFMLDIDCLKQLDGWIDDINIFEILKLTNVEIRHSNTLAWLLDPNENHGLGDSFLKAFISKVLHFSNSDVDLLNIPLHDFYTYQVYREYNHMDIVLMSKKESITIVIENKIWSGESPTQLKKYFENSRLYFPESDYLFYVFLTPDGRDSSYDDNWIALSYENVIEALVSSYSELKLRDEVVMIIRSYVDIVRKKIMKVRDDKLVKICNDIYNKHRTALRLIYENAHISNSYEIDIALDTLREMNHDGDIIFEDSNRLIFFTKPMNDYLPMLSNNESSWGTDWVYYYWLELLDEKMVVHFELGGWNLTEELKVKTNALIEASGKKLGEYRYKRLYYKAIKISQDDYENSIRSVAKRLVRSALDFEEKLLSNIQL